MFVQSLSGLFDDIDLMGFYKRITVVDIAIRRLIGIFQQFASTMKRHEKAGNL
jgi:hypothetical protein